MQAGVSSLEATRIEAMKALLQKSATTRCCGCWLSCRWCLCGRLKPEAHTLLFVLSVLAIVPLHTAEPCHRVGRGQDRRCGGGLLNATLGNLTELVIALTR